jgi:hypothetical protein
VVWSTNNNDNESNNTSEIIQAFTEKIESEGSNLSSEDKLIYLGTLLIEIGSNVKNLNDKVNTLPTEKTLNDLECKLNNNIIIESILKEILNIINDVNSIKIQTDKIPSSPLTESSLVSISNSINNVNNKIGNLVNKDLINDLIKNNSESFQFISDKLIVTNKLIDDIKSKTNLIPNNPITETTLSTLNNLINIIKTKTDLIPSNPIDKFVIKETVSASETIIRDNIKKLSIDVLDLNTLINNIKDKISLIPTNQDKDIVLLNSLVSAIKIKIDTLPIMQEKIDSLISNYEKLVIDKSKKIENNQSRLQKTIRKNISSSNMPYSTSWTTLKEFTNLEKDTKIVGYVFSNPLGNPSNGVFKISILDNLGYQKAYPFDDEMIVENNRYRQLRNSIDIPKGSSFKIEVKATTPNNKTVTLTRLECIEVG